MGPDGFHRRFVGADADAGGDAVAARLDWRDGAPVLVLAGTGMARVSLGDDDRSIAVAGEHRLQIDWIDANQTYDLVVEAGGWRREFAGRAPKIDGLGAL